MIASLVGHIFQATVNRIAKVEEDYHGMMELKKKAEAADVAKSQVPDSSNIFWKDLFSFTSYVYVILIIL